MTSLSRRIARLESAQTAPPIGWPWSWASHIRGELPEQARAAILAAAGVSGAELIVMLTRFGEDAVAMVRAGARVSRLHGRPL
jgi:hypothetical protein